jgi:ribosomal protein S18 acetylase RimI-like enzyme
MFRQAESEDLLQIVRLLSDDDLGSQREQYDEKLPDTYRMAFEEITADPNNEIIVAEENGKVLGCLQITLIPNLTFQGGRRMQIEGVRIDRSLRGQGAGEKLLLWAIDRAKAENCVMVQLTSNKERPDAIRFYENLGFACTHEGMKLYLG